MGNDLNFYIPALLFVILIVFLGSFFINEHTLTDTQNIKESDMPFQPVLVGENDSYDEESDSIIGSETNWGEFLFGALTLVAGGLLAVFAPGIGIPILGGFIAGYGGLTMLTSNEYVQGVLSDIPLIGSIINSIDWINTALNSFASLITLDIPVLDNYLWLKLLILVPVWFTFFYLIVKTIRGN